MADSVVVVGVGRLDEERHNNKFFVGCVVSGASLSQSPLGV